MGTGSPTVIFDAGWEDWSPAWSLIQPSIARYTRACTYDRAGSGFSSAGPMPRNSVEIARELHAALHRGHIPGPYLLVGHSFGSYTTRTFADLYMPEVYGLVLVDGESGDLAGQGSSAADQAETRAMLVGLAACRDAIANHQPLPTLPAHGPSADSAPPIPCSHQFFRGLPMPEWSPELNAAVLRIANSRIALYNAVISEMQEMPADEQFLKAHRRSFGHRPIRVLTAQNHAYDTANTPPDIHARHLADESHWAAVQRQYLSLSTNSRQILATQSGHYIQFDQPSLVIAAIRSEIHR
ncbi:MAG: alpha/beta fold hydrolase [Acidobacteriota bacterium]